MSYQAYPKFLYAAGGRSLIVQSEQEHRALGAGYYESPADVPTSDEAEPAKLEGKRKPGRPRKEDSEHKTGE